MSGDDIYHLAIALLSLIACVFGVAAFHYHAICSSLMDENQSLINDVLKAKKGELAAWEQVNKDIEDIRSQIRRF